MNWPMKNHYYYKAHCRGAGEGIAPPPSFLNVLGRGECCAYGYNHCTLQYHPYVAHYSHYIKLTQSLGHLRFYNVLKHVYQHQIAP